MRLFTAQEVVEEGGKALRICRVGARVRWSGLRDYSDRYMNKRERASCGREQRAVRVVDLVVDFREYCNRDGPAGKPSGKRSVLVVRGEILCAFSAV